VDFRDPTEVLRFRGQNRRKLHNKGKPEDYSIQSLGE
jgi:hypothetical protein